MTVFTPWTPINNGDTWTAADHNAKFRDNFAVTPPGCFTAAGQVLVATGADAGAVIDCGADGQILEYDDTADPKVINSFGYVPVGGIVMWSGLLGALPANWQICDGTNGTPNLRDRFVVGAGAGALVPGATGGGATANLAHTHAITSGSDGAHTHTQGATGAGSSHTHTQASGAGSGEDYGYNDAIHNDRVIPSHTHNWTTGAEAAHTHVNPDVASGGSHQHTITTNSQLSAAQAILPPYYALAYIMRLS